MTKKLNAHVVLDRSGSMTQIAEGTVDSVNEYASSLKKGDRISLTLFDSNGVIKIRDSVKRKNYENLTVKEYAPAAMTPLYDAIGGTIHDIKKSAKKGSRQALIIVTDGLENASLEYSLSDIKKMCEYAEKKDKWLIIYLGANQDALKEGEKFGVNSDNSMTYNKNTDLADVMRGLSSRTATYASTGDMGAFSDEDRAKAMEDKNN